MKSNWMILKVLIIIAAIRGATTGLAQETPPAIHRATASTPQPYSADEKTEQVRTLPDGSRVSTVLSKARIYRDSKGRTRREVSLPEASAVTSNRVAITISDGVAGLRWELDPATMMAYRETLVSQGTRLVGEGERRESGGLGERGPGREGQRREGEPHEGERHEGERHEGERHEGERGGEGGHRESREGGSGGRTGAARQHEDLGFKLMEGLNAHGSRNTWNLGTSVGGSAESIVDERWVSVELGIVVKSIHNDPRTGETVLTLTNIKRVEPEASLFQVPPGYTVKQPSQGK